MNKLKIFLAVLLTLGVVAFGLFLPKLTAGLVDASGADAVASGDMSLPELSGSSQGLTRTEAEDSLYKLGQLDKADIVPVADELGSYSMEQMNAVAYGWLDTLLAEGVVEGPLQFQDASLYLSINRNDLSDYYLLWRVIFGGGSSKKESYHLELLVDDETGKLLSASFSSSTECTDLYSRMDALTNLYFTRLWLDRDTYFTHEKDGGSYLNWVYTLPAGDTKITEIQFEMDRYYFAMYLEHYDRQVEEP